MQEKLKGRQKSKGVINVFYDLRENFPLVFSFGWESALDYNGFRLKSSAPEIYALFTFEGPHNLQPRILKCHSWCSNQLVGALSDDRYESFISIIKECSNEGESCSKGSKRHSWVLYMKCRVGEAGSLSRVKR